MFTAIKNYFKIRKLRKLVRNKTICYLTGAGVSIDSGINPFRGKNGIYTNDPDLIYKLRPDSFETDPQFLYEFHENFRKDLESKYPNIIHDIISQTAKYVITQNIDDLHEKSGFQNVIHVHGSVNEFRCRSCHFVFKGTFNVYDECSRCGEAMLRHNVVLFKEHILLGHLALLALDTADVFISTGTSGNIYPVAQYPKFASGLTICINPELPANSHLFDYVLIGNVGNILNQIFKE